VIKGTHTTNFFDKSAAGNTARPESVTIYLIRDGKIVEHNGIGDFAQCMEQFETK
jgi:predicted ester cyclase